MVDPALAEVTNGAKVMTHGMFKPGFSSLASADLDTGDYRGAQRIAEELAAADDKFTRMNALRHLAVAERCRRRVRACG